jgi:hypothetical protein
VKHKHNGVTTKHKVNTKEGEVKDKTDKWVFASFFRISKMNYLKQDAWD